MVEIFKNGDFVVSAITEREGPARRPSELFVGLDMQKAAPYLKELPLHSYCPATGRLMHTYQSFLLQTPTQNIIIDTCVGDNKARPPHFGFPKQDWLDTFKATGLSFDDIDIVINTHLHVDHVGWNTVLDGFRWVPTFPKAKYLMGQHEHDFWQEKVDKGFELPGRIFTDSVIPILASGQGELVSMDYRLNDHIWFSPAPGHTPGQFMVNVEAGNQRIIFATDAVHHPLQVRLPEHATIFCEDKPLAVKTRMELLEEVADTDTVLIPEHFAYPVAGRVVRDGERYRWVYLGDE